MVGYWAELSSTSAYAGVVSATSLAKDGTYDTLIKEAPPGVTVWYSEHASGALWIATTGQHAEPITKWLHAAHSHFRVCDSILAAVVANEMPLPRESAYFFRIPRQAIRSSAEERVILSHFTIYLPHTDEFLILTEQREGLGLVDLLREKASRETGLVVRGHVARAEGDRKGSGRSYDPIEAHIREVMGPASDSAVRTAAELARDWIDVLGEQVPDDINSLEGRIVREREQTQLLITPGGESGVEEEILSYVDRYAQTLREVRRAAFDLGSRIRDYEWPRRNRATYESVATPMMLSAFQRYATDLAEQLQIVDCVFLPVVGQNFAMTSRLFPSLRTPPSGEKPTRTVVIEVPAETLLRLGALPMVAREVAGVVPTSLSTLAEALVEEQRKAHPSMDLLLPVFKSVGGRTNQRDLEDNQRATELMAKETARYLLAAAISGPPFVFAMARFAVGMFVKEERSSFFLRLAACLGLLRALRVRAEFRSAYLPAGEIQLPDSIVALVQSVTENVQPVCEADLDRIARDLSRGKTVHARPTTILAALWGAVSTGGSYVHEIAAAVSVAGGRL